MSNLLDYFKYVQFFVNLDWSQIMVSFSLICTGILGLMGIASAIAAMIPGEHPDKEFQAITDFVKKYSRK